jgi:hypothetical protein
MISPFLPASTVAATPIGDPPEIRGHINLPVFRPFVLSVFSPGDSERLKAEIN